jgi:type II secretory pathway component PulC
MAVPVLGALIGLTLDIQHFQHTLSNTFAPAPLAETQSGPAEQPLNIPAVAAFLGLQPQAGSAADLPVPLTLLASFVEARNDLSRALIQSPEKSGFYRMGESLPGGGTLASVSADQVVIMRNGQRHILTFATPANTLLTALPPEGAAPTHPASAEPQPTAENPL